MESQLENVIAEPAGDGLPDYTRLRQTPSVELTEDLQEAARRFAESPALGVLGDTSATYSEIAARVHARADELDAAGAGPLLSIEVPPGPDWVVELGTGLCHEGPPKDHLALWKADELAAEALADAP